MRLHIRRREVEVNEDQRSYVKDYVRAALGRFARYVSEVWIYLRDANGPRGGIDKKCRIVVTLPSAGRVVVAGADRDVFALVKKTADRARFAVRRHLKRRLERRFRPGANRRTRAREGRRRAGWTGSSPSPSAERAHVDG